MERILEPQLMDVEEQAEAYAASDFTIPHNAFVARFDAQFPKFRGRNIVDLGCGTADPAIRFAKAYPDSMILGIDGSQPMLNLGSKAIEAADLLGRIHLVKKMLPHNGLDGYVDGVFSNSLLHHLPDGKVLWESALRVARNGAPIFVMDLTRPPTIRATRKLVALHAKGAPKQLALDFYNSLRAAFRPEEVRVQLDELGLDNFHVEVVSDRHMMIYGRA